MACTLWSFDVDYVSTIQRTLTQQLCWTDATFLKILHMAGCTDEETEMIIEELIGAQVVERMKQLVVANASAVPIGILCADGQAAAQEGKDAVKKDVSKARSEAAKKAGHISADDLANVWEKLGRQLMAAEHVQKAVEGLTPEELKKFTDKVKTMFLTYLTRKTCTTFAPYPRKLALYEGVISGIIEVACENPVGFIATP